ncbi:hypothetical protein HANVADRAFT_55110 [Hanseniaspora valbyensis NRRL Y-1626]|uniref:PH domain-containing protein n=1 Tax=Hanseniaspora valbyensis NRRL Y-1626 TaxID=766949 RepID=A0A1B7TI42_9ASCO|nr:hypothetical protein HANVADRAFT_55110 [Hanseniaspora valbyensis NRRL Y-1626]
MPSIDIEAAGRSVDESELKVNKQEDSSPPSSPSSNHSIKMNKALIKLKLLNLLKDLNRNDKENIDTIFEKKLLPFIDDILDQIEKSKSYEIMIILKLLLNFSIQMNNSLALVNKIIKYFIIEKKNEHLVLDINQQDQQGNTPLHLASYLNRFDVCNLLLTEYKTIINDTMSNNNNLQPLELTNNFKLYTLMVNLRNDYIKEIANELRLAFNNRDFEHLNDVLIENARNKELLDLNGIDPSTGDTVLIEFIKKGDIVMCDWILKIGQADPFARNDIGKLPKDYIQELIQFGLIKSTKSTTNNNSITTNQAIGKELLKILDNAAKNQTIINLIQPSLNDSKPNQNLEATDKNGSSVKEHKKAPSSSSSMTIPQEIVEPPIMQGYLKKWTNFATGYKLRYFILNPKEGKLSYFKNKRDLWNCRGSLDLRFCYVYLNCSEGLKFEITTQLNNINNTSSAGNMSTNESSDILSNKLPHEKESSFIGSSDNGMLQSAINSNTITWHLKGNHPVETNKWVWCIQGAIRYCKDKDVEINNLSHDNSDNNNNNNNNGVGIISNNGTVNSSSNNNSRKASIVSRKTSLNKNNKAEPPAFNSSDEAYSDSIVGNTTIDSITTSNISELALKQTRQKQIELPSFKKRNGGNFHGNQLHSNATNPISSDDERDSGERGSYDDEKEEEEEDDDYSEEEISDFEDELNDKVLIKIQKNWIQLDNSVVLELNNLIDLFKNMDATESNLTILETLNSLKSSQEKMNTQHYKMINKNEKIINKLNKILKLWIQSVKELEFELISKDDKIEKLQKELRTLKKQQLANNNNESSTTSVSKVKSETSENLDSKRQSSNVADNGKIKKIVDTSDKNEIETNSETTTANNLLQQEKKNIHTVKIVTGEEKNKQAEEEKLYSSSSSDDDEFFDFDDFEDTNTIITQKQTSTSKDSESKEGDGKMVLLPKDTVDLKVDEELKKEASELIDKYNNETTTDRAKINKNVVNLYNNSELKRFLQILLDESFEGYEEGPRLKLKLDADERPKISLWSVLKSMIGKDMTRMSLPVTFNEPTSLLQRVVEDMEYVEILDKASTFYQSSTLRLLYTAIFSVSPYASTQERIAKPFNPLLGETYEFVEPWKNYRCICEQVSHHPPIGAIYMDSPTWEYYGESNVDGNFNGRCFDFKHLGKWFIKLKYGLNDETDLYSFKKPNNQVIGILTGNPQVDNYGEMVLQNHTTGDKCVINFKARGWRSNHAYELKGEVFNRKNEKEWVFGGHWNSEIFAKRCTTATSAKEDQDLINSANIKNTEVKVDGSKFLVWKANKRPKSPFNLTQFAIQLNALPPHLKPHLPRTDTRLRPDQTCMEDGLYDKASSEKHRVEEKQRAARKERAAKNLKWEPVWFKKDKHPVTKDEYWRYTNEYWERRKTGKWDDKCPDIF